MINWKELREAWEEYFLNHNPDIDWCKKVDWGDIANFLEWAEVYKTKEKETADD